MSDMRLLRREDVEAKVGLKRAYIYVLMKQGKFPRPIRMGERCVRWNSLEIEEWIKQRLLLREGSIPPTQKADTLNVRLAEAALYRRGRDAVAFTVSEACELLEYVAQLKRQ